MTVAIPRQGDDLIASIQSDLSDREILTFRNELAERVGRERARGVIVDVSALDVIDSFVARSLQSLAAIVRLRGAETVIVGIRPDVAIALVQFNLDLRPLKTALDLEEARAVVGRETLRGGVDGA